MDDAAPGFMANVVWIWKHESRNSTGIFVGVDPAKDDQNNIAIRIYGTKNTIEFYLCDYGAASLSAGLSKTLAELLIAQEETEDKDDNN